MGFQAAEECFVDFQAACSAPDAFADAQPAADQQAQQLLPIDQADGNTLAVRRPRGLAAAGLGVSHDFGERRGRNQQRFRPAGTQAGSPQFVHVALMDARRVIAFELDDDPARHQATGQDGFEVVAASAGAVVSLPLLAPGRPGFLVAECFQ